MLDTNLSTRPIYNERFVHLALLVLAGLVLALTVFNATRIVTLSRVAGELGRRADASEQRARDLEGQAALVQRDAGGTQLDGLETAAREANTIIDRRIFSWTEFFNRIENNLPAGVMITAVRPNIQPEGILITLSAVGRRVEDLDVFMEQLEATGAFIDLLSRQEEATDEGTYRAVLEGRYAPSEPAPPETPPASEG